MPSQLTLPSILDLNWFSQGPASGWRWAPTAEENDKIVTVRTDVPPVTWAEPVGLAMLAAWSRYQRTRAKRTIVADASLRSPFTWQSGLLPALTGQPRIGGSVVNAVLQPTMFSSESELAGVGEYIEALGISNDEHSLAATYVIEDLARNVFHHASTHGGGAHVAARYDLNDQTLRVGVADCGKGIPSDIRENLGESIGDIEAVTAAMEPEISGSAQPGVNRGVGLYFIRRLALASRGALWLKTGRVLVDIAPRTPDTISVQPVLAGEEWQGCAVGVMLRLEEFDNFQQILEAIRSDLGAAPFGRRWA